MARYLIGIDLGTTNSALAAIDLKHKPKAGRPEERVFPVPQLVAPGRDQDAREVRPRLVPRGGPGHAGDRVDEGAGRDGQRTFLQRLGENLPLLQRVGLVEPIELAMVPQVPGLVFRRQPRLALSHRRRTRYDGERRLQLDAAVTQLGSRMKRLTMRRGNLEREREHRED